MRYILIFFALAVLSGGISYLASGSLLTSLVISVLMFLYGVIFLKKKIELSFKKYFKADQCFYFINSFLISLSMQNSMLDAYQSALINVKEPLKTEILKIEHLTVEEKLQFLNEYFAFDLYQMFLNILDVYVNQGGDILLMSELLLKETSRLQQHLLTHSSYLLTKSIELIILWVITFGIIIFMRFGLSYFYALLLNSEITILMVISIFAIFSFALFLTIRRFADLYFLESKSDDHF
jgi:hypothetical protein